MTAKEMFEKQGFSYRSTDDVIEYLFKSINSRRYLKINFDLKNKTYFVMECDDIATIDMDIHKAIQKQLEELGWLE